MHLITLYLKCKVIVLNSTSICSVKSSYSANEYKPRVVRSAATGTRRSKLVPSSYLLDTEFTPRTRNSCFEAGRQNFHELFHREPTTNGKNFEKQLLSSESVDYSAIINKVDKDKRLRMNRPSYSGFGMKTSLKLPNLNSRPQTCVNKESCVKVPSFVQLETLRPGQCFVGSVFINNLHHNHDFILSNLSKLISYLIFLFLFLEIQYGNS